MVFKLKVLAYEAATKDCSKSILSFMNQENNNLGIYEVRITIIMIFYTLLASLGWTFNF